MFCQNCGTKIEDGLKFCTNCGARIDAAGVSVNQEKTANVIQPQPAGKKFFTKKNTIILIGIIALAAIAAVVGIGVGGILGGGVTRGTLTITDIPSAYNGKYIYLYGGSISENTYNSSIFGCESVSDPINRVITCVRISNGKAAMPMWRSEPTSTGYDTYVRYYGNDTLPTPSAYIYNTRVGGFGEEEIDYIVFFSGITFTNGGATVSANDGVM
jgi:hypothetical protein